MSFFDDEKPNNDHYYSPGEENEDSFEVREDEPYSSHYYSPPRDEEDEPVLPFSHVDLDDGEFSDSIGENDRGEHYDEDLSREYADNGVIDEDIGFKDEDIDGGSSDQNESYSEFGEEDTEFGEEDFSEEADEEFSEEADEDFSEEADEEFSEEELDEAFDPFGDPHSAETPDRVDLGGDDLSSVGDFNGVDFSDEEVENDGDALVDEYADPDELDEFVEPAPIGDPAFVSSHEDGEIRETEVAKETDNKDFSEEEPYRFVAEDDGYDYSSTDDADDIADDDNVFDKEPEYLFSDEFPEEPESLGSVQEKVVENDYMKDQLTFDDFGEFQAESSQIKEDFFTTPPKPDPEPVSEEAKEFGEETEEPVVEPVEEPVVEPVVEPVEEIEEEFDEEPVKEPDGPAAAYSEATEELGEVEADDIGEVKEFETEYIGEENEAEQAREREAAFERERAAALSARSTNEYETPAKSTLTVDGKDGGNDSEQKKIREKKRYMFMEDSSLNVAKIMVCGVGGAGNNAVNRMIDMNVSTAAFVAINTDKQALMLSKCDMENRYQIGSTETKGLGAGADPDVGERAAEESRELIEEIVDGVDLLFIAAGMGGGTGTGAAPVIARIAREKGCVTVAVVTKPFGFEGRRRAANAERGIANLKKYVDTIIIIPNDKLMEALRPDTPIVDALRYADDTLRQGICGIADLIATPSLINLDFADVRTVIKDQGLAHMGIGRAKGDNRIMEAVREAVSSPLLETTIEGARGIILNVTGGVDLTIRQVNDAARQVQDIIDPSANIIFGMNINEKLQEEVIITLIATGFDSDAEMSEDAEEDGDSQARAYQKLFSRPEESKPEEIEPETEPLPQDDEPEKPTEKDKGGIPSFMRRLFKK